MLRLSGTPVVGARAAFGTTLQRGVGGKWLTMACCLVACSEPTRPPGDVQVEAGAAVVGPQAPPIGSAAGPAEAGIAWVTDASGMPEAGAAPDGSGPDGSGSSVTPPIAPGLVFSHSHGTYETPFDLVISHQAVAEVLYTLDGSDPRSSPTALSAPVPLTLHIDPEDTTHRYLAPGVVVRVTTGTQAPPEQVSTATYLFIDRVVDLSPDGVAPGPQWPDPTDTGGRSPAAEAQAIDYGMDPDVTGASEYSSLLGPALRSLPSVSLVTDLGNLFDPSTGIYVNAVERGDLWERFGSVELLPDGAAPGFQANAGIRIRGGFSRQGSNPKHAFRLYFRGDYGLAKLRYPLFESEGVAEFDKIDLRTAQNYSWHVDGADLGEMTANRDVFSRDLQRELGRPYTRSRYYHLFLNGVYWGLYQTQERSEAKYAASYFGGSDEDYDVVKVNRVDDVNTLEAADGTLDSWRAVWDLSELGFESDARYYALEGRGPDGARDPALPVLVDIDNLIDFMLVAFYTSNFDGPVSKWFQNQDPNNFFAVKNRVDNEHGFVFFAHDNEHTLMAEPITITSGVDENRVSIGDPGGATNASGMADERYRMDVGEFERFHPQWLHHRLTANAAYRARFAARARVLLATGGLMTEAPATTLFQQRAQQIELAIIAESARWGDAKRPEEPRTKNDDWLPAIDRVTSGFFPSRTSILAAQLEDAGLY